LRADGGTLTLAGSWTNNGTLSVINSGVLNLGGTFSTAGVGSLINDGTGTTNLTGTLDNTASTFTLDDTTGSLHFNGGTIQNGTITVTPASTSAYLIDIGNATLDNVILDIDLTIGNARTLTILNDLVLGGINNPTPTITIASTGSSTRLRFNSVDATLGGTGTILLQDNGSNNNFVDQNPGTTTLTIGAGITIRGRGTIGQNSSLRAIDNLGTIIADSGTLTVTGINWTNNNILRADGGTLTLAGSWNNTGTLNVINSGLLNLGGTFATAGVGSLINDGTGTSNLTGTLDNTASTFTLDDTTGSLHFNGGTIQNGTITVTPASTSAYLIDIGNATLDNVTLDIDLTIGNARTLTILNDLTLGGINNPSPTITIASTGSSTRLRFNSVDATLGGTGTILLQDNASNNNFIDQNSATSTLTIGAGITIHGRGTIGQNSSSRAINNLGSIIADSGTLIVTGVNWTNNNILRADGGTLTLAGSWTNNGTLSVINSGVLNLGGTFSTAGVGSLINDGTGTTNLTGTLDNTASTFTLDDTTGSLHFNGGTIQNGTITVTPASTSAYLIDIGNATLDNVILDIDLTIGNARTLTILNDLVLGGINNPTPTITIASTGSSTRLRFNSVDATLGGTGTILLQDNGSNNNFVDQNPGTTTLTIGAGITIRGRGTIGQNSSLRAIDNLGTIIADSGTLTVTGINWTNNNILRADGGTLTLAGSWNNTGTLNVINSGLLNLGGTFATAGVGSLINDGTGTSNLTGTLDNTASTFTLDDTTGSLHFNGGTIQNGTITVTPASTSAYLIDIGNATLDNVTLDIDLTIGNARTLTILNDLTLGGINNPSPTITIASTGSSTRLRFNSVDATLGGTGTILLQDNASNNNFVDQNSASSTLTIGAGITLRGRGTIGQNSSSRAINNLGAIIADSGTLIVTGVNWVNNGILRADGGNLSLAGTWSNTGALNIINSGVLTLGGTFTTAGVSALVNDGSGITNLTGTLDNTASIFTLDDTTGSLHMFGGTILNGTISVAPASTSQFLFDTSSGTFDNVTVDANLTISNGKILTILNGLTLGGLNNPSPTITLASTGSSTTLRFSTVDSTLGGTGTILLQDNGSNNNLVNQNIGTSTLTIGAGITIRGRGTIGLNSSTRAINNQGTIIADSGTLTVTGVNWVNNGTLRADGGLLQLSGTWSNTGTLNVINNSELNLGGTFTSAGVGALVNDGTGTTVISGILNNTATTFLLDDVTGDVHFKNGTVNGGTLSVALASSSQFLLDTGNATFDGVTLDADLFLSDSGLGSTRTLTINNGLTLGGINNPNPTITISSTGFISNRILFASVDQTINGTGTILFNNFSSNNSINQSSAGSTLTLGSNIIVRGVGTIGGTGTVDNLGLIEITTPGILTLNGVINNGIVNVANGGTISLLNMAANDATMTIAPGSTLITNNQSLTNNGQISGTGMINLGTGTLTNAGLIEPGGTATVGVLTVNGDFIQTASGTLLIDASGANPGVTHDLLVVNGTVTVDGNLTVGLIGGYTPSVKDTIRFITTDGSAVSGSFSGTVSLPAGFGAPVIGLSFVEIVRGATIFWTGAGGDNDWFNIANWNTGVLPVLLDDVEITGSGPVNFNGTSSINSLFADQTFNMSGGVFTITVDAVFNDFSLTGGIYTSNGTTTVNGVFTASNATIAGAGSLLTNFLSSTSINNVVSTITNWNSLGSVSWNGGNFTVNTGTFTNNGSFDITSIGLIDGTGTFNNAGLLTVNNSAGTANISASYSSTGSIIDIAPAASFGLNGAVLTLGLSDELRGSGEFVGDVINGGIVSPGGTGTTGILTIAGNYTQTAAGILNIELNGVVPGTQHDQLLLNGAVTAQLGGTLNISLISAYTPLASDNYQFISVAGGTVANTFGVENIPVEFNPNVVNYAATFVDISMPVLGVFFDNELGDFDLGNPLNWSDDTLPISGLDDIVLNFSGQTLTLVGGAISINTLDLTLGTTLDISGGTFNIVSDSILNGDLTLFGGSITGAANLTLNGDFIWDGGDVAISGNFQTNGNSTLNSLTALIMSTNWTNFGTVDWQSGDLQLANSTFTNNGAFIASASGTLLQTGTSGFTNNGGGLFSVDTNTTVSLSAFTQNGTLRLNGGDLTIPTLNNAGLLDGSGMIIGDVTNNGTISPGIGFESIGTITIDGNYDQAPSGNLAIELNGITAGVGHDQLIVGGIGITANLGGTLNVTLFTTYTPTTDDNFQFITVGGSGPTFTGTFANEFLPAGFSPNTVNYAALSADITFPAPGIFFDNELGDFELGVAQNWSTNVLPTSIDNIVLDFNGQTLILSSGSLSINTLDLTLGTTLNLTGGTLILASNSTLNGIFTLNGGTLSSTAALAINGTFNWTAGDLVGGGSLTINNPALLNINGNSLHQINTFTLTNNSNNAGNTWSMTSAANIAFTNASFTNNGILTINNDGVLASLGGVNAFNNAGTLTVNTVSTASVLIPFVNTGTIDIQNGTFSFASSYIQNAGTTALSGGSLSVTTLNLNGGVLSGSGTVTGNVISDGGSIRPGTAFVANTLTINGNYSDVISGGSEVAIKLESALNDQLIITGSADFSNTTLRLIDSGATISNGMTISSVVSTGSLLNPFASVINPFVLFNVAAVTNVNNIDLLFTLISSGLITWTGSGDGVSWNDPANWDFGIPNITNPVTIGNFNITVTGGGNADSILLGSGGSLTLLSGTFSIASNSTIDGALILNGGNLSSAAAITQNGDFTWTAGNLLGGGSLTVANPAVFTIDGSGNRSITSFALLNNSNNAANAWSMTAAADINFNNASFTNNGTLNITSDGRLNNIGGTNAFTNNGVLTANSVSTANILLPFTNSGAVNVQTGALDVTAGYTQTAGTTTVDSILVVAGNSSLNGLLAINNGAAATFNNTTTISNLDTFGTAILAGNGNVTVNGIFTATGLTLQGAGLFTLTGNTSITGNLILDGRNVTIASGSVVNTSSLININNGALLTIDGLLDLQNDTAALVVAAGTGDLTINSTGRLVKSGGAASSVIDVTNFTQNGLLEVLSGTMQINNVFTNAGSIRIALATTMDVLTNTMINTGLVEGSGTFAGNLNNTSGVVSPGIGNSTGTLIISGNYSQGAGGTLQIDIAGTPGSGNYDKLLVTGAGGAVLDGALRINEINGFSSVVATVLPYEIIDATSGFSGDFGGKFIYPVGYSKPTKAGNLYVLDDLANNTVFFDNFNGTLDWNSANNWSTGFVPVIGLDVDTSTFVTGGTILISGGTHQINNLVTASNIENSGGTLIVVGNVTVPANFVYTQSSAAAFTQFEGVFNNTSSTAVVIDNISGSMNFNGTINAANISNTGTMTNIGTINAITIANNTNGLMTLNGTTVGNITNNGDLIIDGTVTGDLTNDGSLSGSGTVTGNVTNGGEFSPGNSPGTFTINGDLTLLASSILNIEIAGLVQGVDYDELIVTGNVLFAGRLNIIVDNSSGYTGNLDDSFKPVTFSSGSGSLALTASTGYGYELTIDGNNLNLLTTLVPGLFVPDVQSDVVTLTSTIQNITNIESISDIEAELVISDEEEDDDEGATLVCS